MFRGDDCTQHGRVRFALRELFFLGLLLCVAFGIMSWSSQIGVLALAVVAIVVAWWAKRGLAFCIWLFAITLLVVVSVITGVPTSRIAQPRTQCSNNLRAIMCALQQYHDIHKSFPPAALSDRNGKPMHSWRVLILPYLGDAICMRNIGLMNHGMARITGDSGKRFRKSTSAAHANGVCVMSLATTRR